MEYVIISAMNVFNFALFPLHCILRKSVHKMSSVYLVPNRLFHLLSTMTEKILLLSVKRIESAFILTHEVTWKKDVSRYTESVANL